MENISNKISPLFNRLFSNQLFDRIISGDDHVNSSANTHHDNNSHETSTKNEYQKNPTSGIPDFQYHTQSRYLQGRHLGRLNPSLYLSEETEDLYEIQPGHIGRVWFSVSYNKRMELLKVTIHKARNLRQMSINSKSQYVGSSSVQSGTFSEEHATVDYRVKVFIEQAEKKCHVTAIKKHTINPDFNESFCFQIAPHSISQKSLNLHVLSTDRRRRCILIGRATFTLDQLISSEKEDDNKTLRIYRDLEIDFENPATAYPQLFVALTYFPSTERLIVGLFECRNLPLRENDIYAKVTVCQGIQGKELKAKRTEALGSKEGFNESFVFQKISDPSSINVRITLIQHGFIDKQLGFVVLGGEMVSKGRGVDHWRSMIERPEEQVGEWQEIQMY
uniref:C2 domain-containing protein n=1 Tax=Trichobilharzia regenti TaxID=157069 RepID=A0AA85KKS3_TRIRE|nr:unnamed protein product [Trichobilharzia regenti]